MCGRYELSHPEDVDERFEAALRPDFDEHHLPLLSPRFNIAPSQDVLAVARSREGARVVQAMRWGLVQSWAKDAKSGPRPINLRAESILDRAHLRKLLEQRRCIIPAEGFYEWQTAGKRRQPWHLALAGSEMFGFAGLYDVWREEDGWLLSCTILTTKPNDLVARLHDRMPVILPREAEALWLDKAANPHQLLDLCLPPLPAQLMHGYPIVPLVNDVRNEGPELLAPVSNAQAEPAQQALFG